MFSQLKDCHRRETMPGCFIPTDKSLNQVSINIETEYYIHEGGEENLVTTYYLADDPQTDIDPDVYMGGGKIWSGACQFEYDYETQLLCDYGNIVDGVAYQFWRKIIHTIRMDGTLLKTPLKEDYEIDLTTSYTPVGPVDVCDLKEKDSIAACFIPSDTTLEQVSLIAVVKYNETQDHYNFNNYIYYLSSNPKQEINPATFMGGGKVTLGGCSLQYDFERWELCDYNNDFPTHFYRQIVHRVRNDGSLMTPSTFTDFKLNMIDSYTVTGEIRACPAGDGDADDACTAKTNQGVVTA